MQERFNDRGHREQYVSGRHLKLDQLKVVVRGGNRYLSKENIPDYPQPEFLASHLKHDTDLQGLKGIREMEGFRNPKCGSLLWWNLVVGPEEIETAERRLLETTYPDQTKEQIQTQQRFLEQFATSQVFKSSSMFGSNRFTFPVKELLEAYREQFCSGAELIMRVMETILYKQEVEYVVLVHSPANQEQYSQYPLLSDNQNPICSYEDGCFLWRSEAMCETHSFELVQSDAEKKMRAVGAGNYPQFYVWDNVAIALHVGDKVLKFDVNRLRENLTFCERATVTIVENALFQDFTAAEKEVAKLWPGYPPLMKDGEIKKESPQEYQYTAEGLETPSEYFCKKEEEEFKIE
ncbi:uncharacterized protein LOC117808735 [Notolabrus celidotus]|uniref:uncharacterized protein LOC117808735 n=1 Tax=Notolabrus celidotus TaxID=1203425 RepID=UPI00148FA76E|nr:uncharacterized protein LOC117808735 [Notolabrus celidotus]XP_034534300.1 uncharacterized protein LOC117808735 [Notolabrus celidotus]